MATVLTKYAACAVIDDLTYVTIYGTGAVASERRGQSFLHATAHQIKRVIFYGYKRSAASGNLTCNIYATAAGIPTGASLATGSKAISEIGADVPEWITIDLEGFGAEIESSTLYCFTLEAVDCTATNDIVCANNKGEYGSGKRLSNINEAGWTTSDTEDMNFEEWGEPI